MPSIPVNPFNDWTYRERRALLGFSAAAIAMTRLGLVPDAIVPLGVHDLTTYQRGGLITSLLVLIVYFLGMFVLYAATDLLRWWGGIQEEELELVAERAAHSDIEGVLADKTDPELRRVGQSGNFIDQARVEHEIQRIRLRAKGAALDAAKQSPWFRLGNPASWARVFVDSVFPIVVGLVALSHLWRWQP
jgi:hypothetical protein